MEIIRKIFRELKAEFKWAAFILGAIAGFALISIILLGVVKVTPEYFGTVGDWVSGIGALLAVFVSLYLTYKSRPHYKLHLTANVNRITTASKDVYKYEIRMENMGTLPITIDNLFYYYSNKNEKISEDKFRVIYDLYSRYYTMGEPKELITLRPGEHKVIKFEYPPEKRFKTKFYFVKAELTNGDTQICYTEINYIDIKEKDD